MCQEKKIKRLKCIGEKCLDEHGGGKIQRGNSTNEILTSTSDIEILLLTISLEKSKISVNRVISHQN